MSKVDEKLTSPENRSVADTSVSQPTEFEYVSFRSPDKDPINEDMDNRTSKNRVSRWFTRGFLPTFRKSDGSKDFTRGGTHKRRRNRGTQRRRIKSRRRNTRRKK